MKLLYVLAAVFACLTSQSFASGGPFMLYFDPNRSDLSQPALAEIRMASDFYTLRKLTTVRIVGHADRAEADDEQLSLRRANVVRDQLVRQGVPPTAITVVDKRTTQPLVDRAGDPQNRRVEIFIPLQ